MSLVTKVKAANITNLSDARYCAGMGVDWIGFPAAEVNPTIFSEITGWLSGPQWVVELGCQPWGELAAYPTSVWQCFLADLDKAFGLPGRIMVQVEIQDWPQSKAKLLSSADRIEAIIINKFSGILESDKKSVELISQHFPILIDMNEVGYELAEILTWNVAGIQLHGSSEERPGLKDYTQLADVLEKLEVD
jgi:phosphoribosylanthranilate isomerase